MIEFSMVQFRTRDNAKFDVTFFAIKSRFSSDLRRFFIVSLASRRTTRILLFEFEFVVCVSMYRVRQLELENTYRKNAIRMKGYIYTPQNGCPFNFVCQSNDKE